jgi:hypothetical protein
MLFCIKSQYLLGPNYKQFINKKTRFFLLLGMRANLLHHHW